MNEQPPLPPRKPLSKAIAELSPITHTGSIESKGSARRGDFRSTLSDALDLLVHYSLPVHIDNDLGRPELVGTGFIVNKPDRFYFVTAKHVLDYHAGKTAYFYSDLNVKRLIVGTALSSPRNGEEGKDLIDIAVVRLEGEGLPPYPGVKRMAVEYDHLSPKRTPRSGRTYVLPGYPVSKSKVRNDEKNIYIEPTAYYNASIAEGDYPSDLHPEYHIVVGWDPRKSLDREGRKIQFPKPQGMSGSPIIELYDTEARGTQDYFPIVGVATDCRKSEKIMFGSDIASAVDMIDSLEIIEDQ